MATVTEPLDIALQLLKGDNDPPYDPDNPYWQDPNWKNYVDPDPPGAFGIPQSTWDEIAARQEEEGNKVETPQEIAMRAFNSRTENVYDSPDTHCQLHGERLQPIIDPQSIRQFPKGADENMYCTACEQNITGQLRQPRQFDIDEDTRQKLTGEPMDIAMRLLKAPYDIDGEVHDRLYQGGREGDPDSGYWPSSHQEALTYAMMGSDQDMGMRTDGVPQIRVAPETDEMHYLNSDPETSMVGMAEKNAFPHEIQSRQETAGDIEQLLSQLKDDPYADDDEDYPYNESQSEIAPFMDTGARDVSNAKRIAHIEEMHNRVKTGAPMDIAMQLLKAKSKGQESLTEWTKEKWEFVGDDKKEMKKPRHKRGRYAPKSVAASMSPSQKATENKTKRAAHKKGKQHAPRGKSVKPMYRAVEGKK